MLRYGQRRVLQDDPAEMALRHARILRLAEDLAPEVRKTTVRNDSEVREERLLLHRTLLLARRAHAQDASRQRTLDELRHGGLDDVDTLGRLRLLAELLDEAAVVECAPLAAVRVGDVDGRAVEDDAVAVGGDRVDAVDTVFEAELLECHDAARLEEFADYAVGLRERSLKQAYAKRTVALDGGDGESVGEGAAGDAGTDDDYVVRNRPHGGAKVSWSGHGGQRPYEEESGRSSPVVGGLVDGLE